MKKDSHQQKKVKIDFFHLFKIFRKQVIFHWFTSIFTATVSFITLICFFKIIFFLGSDIENFTELLPPLLERLFAGVRWNRNDFFFFCLILLILDIFLNYFLIVQREKLQIEGEYYVKSRLLDKFRLLPLEEREKQKKKIDTFLGVESNIIGKFWNNLYNKIFEIFFLLFLIIVNSLAAKKSEQMSLKTICFFVFWILLINMIGFFILRLILRNEKKYKENLSQENNLVSKETSKSILVDSMGLSSQYRYKQRDKFKKNKKLFKSFTRTKALYEFIPKQYPFGALIFVEKFNVIILYFFFYFFATLLEMFKLLKDYGDYSSSLTRINDFLALPEKDDNLYGLKLEMLAIKSIELKNIHFRYQGETKWVLENCQAIFTTKEINKLAGDNGTGKSTILYLILGMLKPTSGQILIHVQNGETYNLKDINLQHWREKIVAYFSHDNLLEEGSTGQRQIKNINSTLVLKKEAQIIIFDEATNALDKESQEWIVEKIARLIKDGKIVIFVEHFK